MISGQMLRICSRKNGEQASTSSGRGLRFPGGAALKHVGNVDVFAFEPRQRQNAVEVLACRPHKGLALQILITARRLANKHHASAGVSHAKHDVVARLVKLAKVTIAQNGLDLLECDLTRRLMAMAGNVHDAHSDSYT